MKLQLITAGERNEPRVKPVNHFQKCPACGCKELINVKPDVLCSTCEWDSTTWDVSRGGMDNLFTASKEFGFPVRAPVQGGISTAPPPVAMPDKQREVEGA